VIRRLYVLYDSRCGICSRLRLWIQNQRAFVIYDFVPAGSERARRIFPSLEHDANVSELVVVTDGGAVYADDAAWILCLWGLREYRSWSHRFAHGPLRPLARAAWDFLSTNRSQLAAMLSMRSDEDIARELAQRPGVCDIT
jgi:predicted DCC family thiol-disulfide oxidoreductase YuxK